MDVLRVSSVTPVNVHNGGLFISRGEGEHPHRVIDSHELIFVDNGVLSMYEDDATFEVDSGHALLLFPGRRHGGTKPYPPSLRFYWIHFTLVPNTRSRTAQTVTIPQYADVPRPERLTELFRHFLDNQESSYHNEQAAAHLLMLMLHEVMRPHPEYADERASKSHLLAQADMLIRTHFHEDISTSVLARMLNCNPDYLGRVFRQVYGYPVTEAIHRRRLHHARNLLMNSTMNIDEIAMASGFHDAGYFRRIFKRANGSTPGQFRKLYARIHINTE